MSEVDQASSHPNARLSKTLEGLSPKTLFADLILAMADAPDTARDIINRLDQVVRVVESNNALDVSIDLSVKYDIATNTLDYGFRVRGSR